MLLVPNDMRRRGIRTEFWLCTACSAILAVGAVVSGSGAMAIAAAYCVCRTVVKSQTGIDPVKVQGDSRG